MERKLKELNATLDQERNQHVEQRDQVNIQICIHTPIKVTTPLVSVGYELNELQSYSGRCRQLPSVFTLS